MPKNSATTILRRWRAMDAALSSFKGLNIRKFARRQGTSEKTIHRDLKAFEALGQRIQPNLHEDGCFWTYMPGVECIFVANLPEWSRERAKTER